MVVPIIDIIKIIDFAGIVGAAPEKTSPQFGLETNIVVTNTIAIIATKTVKIFSNNFIFPFKINVKTIIPITGTIILRGTFIRVAIPKDVPVKSPDMYAAHPNAIEPPTK